MGARLSNPRWWGGTYKRPTPERPKAPFITWTPLPTFDHRLYRDWLQTQVRKVWREAPMWAFGASFRRLPGEPRR